MIFFFSPDPFCHRPPRGAAAHWCQADEKENRWGPDMRKTLSSLQSLTIGQTCFHSDPYFHSDKAIFQIWHIDLRVSIPVNCGFLKGKSWKNSIGRQSCFFFSPFFFKLVWLSAGFLTMVKLFKEWPCVPNRPWVVKQFVEDFEYYAHGRSTNTPPVYIWMLSLGISRGFAFVDFYHLQDATRWMETNQVASQSPSLVLILEIWKKEKNSKWQPKFCGDCCKKGKPKNLWSLWSGTKAMSALSVVIAVPWERLLYLEGILLFIVIETLTVASSSQEFSLKGNKILFTLTIQEPIGTC